MKKEIEITKKHKISSEFIDDLLCTAFEGGINYWCTRVKVIGKYLGAYASEQISKGGKLKLCTEEGYEYELTIANLFKGIKKFIEEDLASVDFTYDGYIDFDYDACDADTIIQYALFDELVYC